ncbi:MAG TPA: PQQ-binding-like beta-propeller repeat protein [Gemmataceae bacterium]
MKHFAWTLPTLLLVAGLAGYRYVGRHGVSVISPTADRSRPEITSVVTAEWPWWRGPLGTGVSLTAKPPLRWSESEGVRWKVAVPGRGHSSPVVCGDRVLLSTADDTEQTMSLLCYRRRDGILLWATPIQRGGFMAKHDKNSHASPTPVCDGRRVTVSFVAEDSLWVTAVDLDGQISWRTRVGPFHSQWGYGSSPAYWRGLVIVAADNKGPRLADLAATTSYLAALDAETGDIVWRVRRPREYSYGTPVVAEVAGRWQVLLAGHQTIAAYDPATGRELWHCGSSLTRTAGTIAFDADHVYASGSFPAPEITCIRADGEGDVSETHVEWRQTRGAADVPSPLVLDGRVLVVNDNGVAVCFDAAGGKVLWQQRLGGAFSASPVAADGVVYAVNEDGRTIVFRAGAKFEKVADNRLDGAVYASPVPVGDDLLIRTEHALYCLTGGER